MASNFFSSAGFGFISAALGFISATLGFISAGLDFISAGLGFSSVGFGFSSTEALFIAASSSNFLSITDFCTSFFYKLIGFCSKTFTIFTGFYDFGEIGFGFSTILSSFKKDFIGLACLGDTLFYSGFFPKAAGISILFER
jgi:hypothetical protein